MKKSKGLFYAGIIGIVLVVVIAVAAVMMSRGSEDGGTASSGDGVVKITCLGGSEKEDLINDPDIRRILKDKYRLEVDFNSSGSYKQVQIPPEELKADKIDCLWPSSASAQAVFEGSGNSKAFGNDYQAASVLQSPEVLYANTEAAEGLTKAGIVQMRDKNYYIVDLRRLLEEYLLPGKSWADLGVGQPSGPVLINSSDPATSNSGMTLAQLELATIASGNPYQPATPEQAGAALGKVKAVGGLREPAPAVDHHTQRGRRSARHRDSLPGADDLQRSPDPEPDRSRPNVDQGGRGRRGSGHRLAALRFQVRNTSRRAGVRGRGRATDASHQENASPWLCGHQASAGLFRQRPVLTFEMPL